MRRRRSGAGTLEGVVTGATAGCRLGGLDVQFEKGGTGGKEFPLIKKSEQVVRASLPLKAFCETLDH